MLRVCFLLLLVVLLPWRGAVAAAMLCPPTAVPVQQGHQPVADATAGHDHHHGHGDLTDDKTQGSSQDSSCHLCTATCSATTLPVHAIGVPAPPEVAGTRFPPLAAPVPDFLSSGQDRPPRSI